MNKGKIAVVILGGAVNGALGACILVWPAQGAIVATIIGLVTMSVAAYTGLTLKQAA